MKSILFITPHLSTGGLPQYLYKKIESFIGDFNIYCIEYDDISHEYVVQKNKIKVLLKDKLITLGDDKKLILQYINDISPDIIHFEEIPESFIDSGILDKIYDENRNYNILVTTHSSNTNPSSIRYLADKFILVSEWSKITFEDHFKDKIPCDIWEYPIDIKKDIDRNYYKEKLGFDKDYLHILNVGLFTPGKNQEEIFRIAKELKEYKVKFHFVGNLAPNFQDYWEPILSSKPDNCIVHGERFNVDEFYSACDTFYFSSNFELNPLVIKEALSYNLPVYAKKLHTYLDNYDNKINYITGDINIDSKLLINNLGLNKRKLKACHLLVDVKSKREVLSIESMSKISKDIDYIQCINERYIGDDWKLKTPLSGWSNHGPGHWGAFTSFRKAILENFTDDLDGLLIFEADCVLDVEVDEFLSIVDKASDFCEKHKLPLFSFGSRYCGGILQSEILRSDNEFPKFIITDKIIEAHCILLTSHMKDYLKDMLVSNWDSPDIFFNEIYMSLNQEVGILRNSISHQEEGISMIDNQVKGTTEVNKNNIYNIEINKINIKPKNIVVKFNNINGPFVEIVSSKYNNHEVLFKDKKKGDILHKGNIQQNCWISCNFRYFKDWEIEIVGGNDRYIYEIDYSKSKVLICIDSRSLGDNLAWLPYVEEFRKKMKCEVICSTFFNFLFKDNYKNIEFIEPGSSVNGIIAQYNIGWYYNQDGDFDYFRVPNNFRLQPMQKTASDILGLEYKEIRPILKLEEVEKENIVSISIHSTAQSKYWNNENGWQKVVDYLKGKGYRVILISKEEDGFMGNIHPVGIEKLKSGPLESVVDILQKSKLFIGVGSGLSWLSWSVGTQTCIISGFSYDYTEPIGDGIIRIKSPDNTCSGCFNRYQLDQGDWNWCPDNKGTERQFECSKKITPDMVIQSIKDFI